MIDFRVMNNFPHNEKAPILENLVRGVRQIDCAFDAVAETELAREMHAEPARLEHVVRGLDLGDEIAVVTGLENVRDFVAAIEAFAEDQRLGLQRDYLTSHARGVTASSARSAAGPVLPTAASICPSSSSSESAAATVRIGTC